MHRLSFDRVCTFAVLIGALVAGAVGGVLGHWTYDQAGDG